MVEQQSDADIDRVFHALADATRRDIVRRTLVSEQSVTQLAAAYAMSFAAVSKHIAVLAEARLITKRAEGRVRLVRADPSAIARAQQLLRSYEDLWRGRVDRLDALLSEEADAGIHSGPAHRVTGWSGIHPSTRRGSAPRGPARHGIRPRNPRALTRRRSPSCPSHPSRATPKRSP